MSQFEQLSAAISNLTELGESLNPFNRCYIEMEQSEFCRNMLDEYFENQGMGFKLGMITALGLLFACGALGNFLVIFSILLFPSMRSRTNIFLLNLAISDLLVFLVCLPITVYNLLQTRWHLGVALCKLSPFLQCVSVCVSIGSLASMSIKRYLVIRYPLTAKERLSNRAMCLWMTAIWILAALISSPIAAVHRITEHQLFWKTSFVSCQEEWASPAGKLAYTLFLFIALYLVPLIAMAIFYSMLGRTLVSTVKFTRQVTNETHQSSLRAVSQGRVKVSKMMIALLMAFAVCWLPHYIVMIYMDLRQLKGSELSAAGNGTDPMAAMAKDSQVGRVYVAMTTAMPITLLMSYANSAINPLCLLLISSKFKKYFKLILTCRCSLESRAARARTEQLQLQSLCSRQQHQQHQQQQQKLLQPYQEAASSHQAMIDRAPAASQVSGEEEPAVAALMPPEKISIAADRSGIESDMNSQL